MVRERLKILRVSTTYHLYFSTGAGKTSTMKIMYGVSPPTLGNAWIFGMDVRTQMRDIRKILGVCPQFDVLYPDLTALEHLRLL